MPIEQLLQHVASLRPAADHPVWVFTGCLVAGTALTLTMGRTAKEPRETRAFSAAEVGALAAIAAYLAIAFWYLLEESYYDFAEPTIAAVSWIFRLGQPVYHALDSAERYSHVYGPLAFIIPAGFLALTAPSILVSKAVGVAAGVLTLVAIYSLTRSATGARNALLLTGFYATASLMHRNVSFWVRPDSMLVLVAAVSLLAGASRRAWVAVAGVAVSTGMLLSLKITGILYAVPAIALVKTRFGAAAAGGAVALAGAAALLPFALFDSLSFEHYVRWLRLSAANGLVLSQFRQNLEWALFLLIPLVPVVRARPHVWFSAGASRPVFVGLLTGLAGTLVAASKPGAGPYHLLPFWPIVIYLAALHVDLLAVPLRANRLYRAGKFALVMAAAVVACIQQAYFIAVTSTTSGIGAASDLSELVAANPGRSIAMGFGYGQHADRLTYLRPLLVFRTATYLIDAPAVQEYQLSGLDIPAATLQAMRRCRVNSWVFPKGGQPFDGRNRYPATGYAQLFPETFKRAFRESYEYVGDTRHFQVWNCRARDSGRISELIRLNRSPFAEAAMTAP